MTLYLDTSSLVKLYVAEKDSDLVRRLVEQATVVSTSVVACAEVRAALARLRREGQVTASQFASAKREFEQQWPAYLTVEVTDSLCREAGEFAERYRLRGYDSVHLASFAEIARQADTRHAHFSSFDDGLNRAARSLRRRLARAR